MTDYGFGMRALRDIGAERERAGEIMSASPAAKSVLVLPACIVLLPVILFVLDLHLIERFAAVLFLLGTLASSYGDLGLTVSQHRPVPPRNPNRGGDGAGAFRPDRCRDSAAQRRLAIGVAFLLSRLIYATFALRAPSRILELGGILRNSRKVLGERFKSSTSFAVDSGATNIFAQLDVIPSTTSPAARPLASTSPARG